MTASRKTVATRNHVACFGSSKSEQSIEQLLQCRKNTSTCITCATFMSLPVFPVDLALMQQCISYRSPVLKKGQTCRCQPVATLRENLSSHFPSLSKSQINEGCLLSNVERLRKLEFGRHLRPCFGKSLRC